jgi:anaerobic dimethyl sulfoxide reductase subunit A
MTALKRGKVADNDKTRVIVSTCAHDCGVNSGKCLLKFHVKNGEIIRVETDDGDEPQLRACARGRASRQRVYAPDRLKYPMKRVGERGEGKFERISWDEALDKIAYEMKRIKELYGPGAFINLQYAGIGGLGGFGLGRLLNMFGGQLGHWGGASAEASLWAGAATYGTRAAGFMAADISKARLIIMWAWNPAINLFESNTPFCLAKAKESGARIICVDPRHTQSAATYADEWIPIAPGTDTAMLIAMAYVMITENLQDQNFLDTYTVGFDRFKDYILGIEDGVAKTPAWAEAITGVSADTIARLAIEYATTKPAALIATVGPGRSAFGEQYHRAANVLAAMTGNLGASTGAAPETAPFHMKISITKAEDVPRGNLPDYTRLPMAGFSKGKNPFDYDPEAPPHVADCLDPTPKNRRRVPQAKIFDAILKGKAGGYPSDIKMAWVYCGNTLNQFPNVNKGVRALKELEFIVVTEQFMTYTAKFADILLPATTHLERNGIFNHFFAHKVIEPIGECKTDFEIFAELAPRLGINNYSDKTEDEWLLSMWKSAEMGRPISAPDAPIKQDVVKMPPSEAPVYFREQLEDPKNNPFPTPSGKIEIFSQELADLNNPQIPPIPKYIETWEGRNDRLAEKYPLQLITTHFRLRAHSNYGNVPWLTQLEPQRVWINTADAQARGIHNGQEVQIFNDRGVVSIPAFVTERIMPGVVNISEGGWYNPDSQGIDRGGCPNTLTKDEHSPAGAWTVHTSLVQVAKA